ncbi:unnamed protein product, partial [Mesorhabditis belari]|uniref:UDP-glucuronate decarboxylase n=1 Tax=Mesorhabditis belari TaxID=2138241 RepID=A0AAF3FCA6_9BILA
MIIASLIILTFTLHIGDGGSHEGPAKLQKQSQPGNMNVNVEQPGKFERFVAESDLMKDDENGQKASEVESNLKDVGDEEESLRNIGTPNMEVISTRIEALEKQIANLNAQLVIQQRLTNFTKTFPPVKFRDERTRKRILITGGCGFVGSHLVDKLMADGHEVLALDNYFTGRKRNVEHWIGHPNFELVHHDVVNPYFVEVDQIYHLASPASPPHYMYNPVKTIKTNTIGTINMLGLAKRVKATMLLASTSEIYGDPEVHPQPEEYWGHVNTIGPRSCYDEGKRVAESLMVAYHKQENVSIRIARIFNTFGPRMHMNDGRVVSNFIIQALQKQPITIYGDGGQTRSFQYVSDLVEGLIALMESDSFIPVNLGNPEEHTIRHFAEIIRDLVDSESQIVHMDAQPDDPHQRKPDIRRADKLLKWKPKVSMREGLQKTIEYFRGQLASGGRLDHTPKRPRNSLPGVRPPQGGVVVSKPLFVVKPDNGRANPPSRGDGYDSFDDDDIRPGPSEYIKTQQQELTQIPDSQPKCNTPRRRQDESDSKVSHLVSCQLLKNRLHNEQREKEKVERQRNELSAQLMKADREKREEIDRVKKAYEAKIQTMDNTIRELRFDESRVDITIASQMHAEDPDTIDCTALEPRMRFASPAVHSKKATAVPQRSGPELFKAQRNAMAAMNNLNSAKPIIKQKLAQTGPERLQQRINANAAAAAMKAQSPPAKRPPMQPQSVLNVSKPQHAATTHYDNAKPQQDFMLDSQTQQHHHRVTFQLPPEASGEMASPVTTTSAPVKQCVKKKRKKPILKSRSDVKTLLACLKIRKNPRVLNFANICPQKGAILLQKVTEITEVEWTEVPEEEAQGEESNDSTNSKCRKDSKDPKKLVNEKKNKP